MMTMGGSFFAFFPSAHCSGEYRLNWLDRAGNGTPLINISYGR